MRSRSFDAEDEADATPDVFDAPEAEATCVFVNPFACNVSPLDWRRLQVLRVLLGFGVWGFKVCVDGRKHGGFFRDPPVCNVSPLNWRRLLASFCLLPTLIPEQWPPTLFVLPLYPLFQLAGQTTYRPCPDVC